VSVGTPPPQLVSDRSSGGYVLIPGFYASWTILRLICPVFNEHPLVAGKRICPRPTAVRTWQLRSKVGKHLASYYSAVTKPDPRQCRVIMIGAGSNIATIQQAITAVEAVITDIDAETSASSPPKQADLAGCLTFIVAATTGAHAVD
jgi:hypothetical protein